MNNIFDTQRDTKSNIRKITLIFAIGLALCVPTLNAYAAPQDSNFGGDCTHFVEDLELMCCWNETDAEGIELRYCQICGIDPNTGEVNTSDCGLKVGVDHEFEPPTPPSPLGGSANVPQDGGVFEQPPTSPPRNDANVPQDSGVFEQTPTSPQQGQKNALEDEASKGSVLQQTPTSPQQGQKNALEDEASKGSVLQQTPTSPQQGQKNALEDEASKGSVLQQ